MSTRLLRLPKGPEGDGGQELGRGPAHERDGHVRDDVDGEEVSVALLIRKDVLDGVSTSTHCAYTLLYGGETLGIFYSDAQKGISVLSSGLLFGYTYFL